MLDPEDCSSPVHGVTQRANRGRDSISSGVDRKGSEKQFSCCLTLTAAVGTLQILLTYPGDQK